MLDLSKIRTDGDIQPREAINEDVVAEYAARMEDGDTFPPVTVYADGSNNWLADGYHRVMAATRIGWIAIDADVRKGTRADAMWEAAGANRAHGLRTTPADRKRHVKQCLLSRPESSNNSIAKHIGVSDHTVAKYRRELESGSQIAKVATRSGSDGKSYPASNPVRKPDEYEEVEGQAEQVAARRVNNQPSTRSVTLAEREALKTNTCTLTFDLNNAEATAQRIVHNCDAGYLAELVGFLCSHINRKA